MARLSIGLDIGTSAVRATELDMAKDVPVLLTYGQVGLPPGSVVNGEIRDPVAVTEAITKLWTNGQFSKAPVTIGIAGLRAITREIELPYVPDDEVASAVRFQSEEVIPFPPDQTILSSQVLADYTNDDGARVRRVLVAAAHAELVDGVIKVVESAGLVVDGVDLISSALIRAIGTHDASGAPEAVVSIGAGLTVVAIHENGRPQFVRTIGSGGNTTTAAISAALDVPLLDAETIKLQIGGGSTQQQAAARAAQPSMADLADEVRNSIQYFASLPGRRPVARVVLTGGGSGLVGLRELLEAQTGLPTTSASPLDRVDVTGLDMTEAAADEVARVLATPIGLALPEPDGVVKKFNLLPEEVAKRIQLRSIERKVKIGGGVLIGLVVLFAGVRFAQIHVTEGNVSDLNSQIASLNAQVPKYDVVVAANNAYTSGVARRQAVLATAVDWPAVLAEAATITPAQAKVQSFDGSAASASTSGGSSTPTTAPKSASIGNVSMNVTGPGPSLAISEAWINAVAGSTLLANPVQGATTANADGSISFPFTVAVTPAASLDKNARLK
jgi:type IV pilus assembly protein PilM